ncbi:MAG: hypothetical protein QNJ73_09875 [Gammaproteobacteria bacterium]|nr:hypothetical protein [Gammaproteobacteria bacterium]
MNKRPTRPAVLLLATLMLVSGCGSEGLQSQADPNADARTYATIVVLADWRDDQWRAFVEDHFVAWLNSRSTVQALRSTDVFPPGQTYTRDSIAAWLAERGSAAVLILNLTDAWGKQVIGGAAPSAAQSTADRVSGFNRATQASFSAVLADDELTTVWQASTVVVGENFANFDDLQNTLADNVVGDLLDKELIPQL